MPMKALLSKNYGRNGRGRMLVTRLADRRTFYRASISKSLRNRFEQIGLALMKEVDGDTSKDSGGVVKQPILN